MQESEEGVQQPRKAELIEVVGMMVNVCGSCRAIESAERNAHSGVLGGGRFRGSR